MITGLELPPGHPVVERGEELDLRVWPEEDVGDGASSVWTTTYYSESRNDTFTFQVLPGEAIALSEAEDPELSPAPMSQWSVDSPQAVEEGLEDEVFNESILGPGASLSSTLRMQEGEPIWALSARSEGEPGQAEVWIHAVEGTLLDEGKRLTRFGELLPGSWGPRRPDRSGPGTGSLRRYP